MEVEKIIINKFKNFLENRQIEQKDIIMSNFLESFKYFKSYYNKIFEEISEGIVVIDDNFLIKDILNDHFCEWVDLKKKDCINKSIFKFFNRVFEVDEKEITNLYLKKDNELIPVYVKIIKENIEKKIFYKLIILNQKEINEKDKKLYKLASLYKSLSIINDLILRAIDINELFNEIVKTLVNIGKYEFALIGRIDKDNITPLSFFGNINYEKFLKHHKISKDILKNIKNDYCVSNDMDKEEYAFSKKIIIPFNIKNEFVFLKHKYLNKKYILILYSKEERETDEIEIGLLKQILHNISYASIFVEKKNYPEFIKHYDIITMLPNRIGFFERVKILIKNNHDNNLKAVLAVIDINSFNRINEVFGFWFGDLILKEIAKIIKEKISKQDFVGRIGGDQFGVWFNNINSEREIEKILNDIFPNNEIKLKIEEHNILLTLSIGIAFYPKDGSDLETLFSRAYTSMKEMKKIGKGIMFFNKSFEKNDEYEKLKLELELIDALKNKEFFLVYQPIIDLKNKKVFGGEALIRWNSPKKGLVNPAKFIPILEEKGMIVEVGYWIMDTICDFLQKHKELKQNISMNVSVKQIYIGNFSELLMARMKKCEKELHKKLIIEVTESVLMENINEFLDQFNKLKEFGVRFEIDDFGTGYSSLSYFKKLPVYALKIDKSFIDNIPNSKEDETIVKAVINMAHILEKKVVAEGVETKEQLKFLEENDCDYIQGYFYSKPLKEEEFIQFINNFNFSGF